jgi:protein O-GlcNAc transferase
MNRALEIEPDNAGAHLNIGVALRALKRPQDALVSFDRALALKPDHAEALNNRGNALRDLKRPQEALASFDRALELRPDYAELHNNRGNALLELKRPQEALASFDRALTLKPDYAEAHDHRGNALFALKRPHEALICFDRALALKPNYAEAHNNRGIVLLDLERPEEALASFEQALALAPDYPEALNHRGAALLSLRRPAQALASFEQALAHQPDYADALNNEGAALLDLNRHEEAVRSYARLVDLAPDSDYALGRLFHSRLRCCDWTQYSGIAERIIGAVAHAQRADVPLSFLAVSSSAAAQLQCARTFAAGVCPATATPLRAGRRARHEKIRVAYLSGDFREHPVSYLLAGLFERHDRKRFETIAISFRREDKSATGQRVKAAFSRFIDVSREGDRELAALMRELEVDIAVDLMGFTYGSRTAILAYRAAPIQVNYLGFPATTGVEYIDYIIADRFVIPQDRQACYTEKVVYLPDSFQANDDRRPVARKPPGRKEVGLPQSGFVFCSFNNSYKINPPVFELWARLLRAVEGSVLWLIADNPAVPDNLRREAAHRGLDPARLVFAPRVGYAEYLARLALADLFLDTLPFNAGTTASDALWAGVPVLTCAGEAFASRMAGSLLHAVGLPELVTDNLDDYEALALKLAAASAMLADVRAGLARNRATCPLFDTDRFRRHLESAYLTMWARHQCGAPPANFAVAPQH